MLKLVATLAYYGDDGVLASLGYDPEAKLARARELARPRAPVVTATRPTGDAAYRDGTHAFVPREVRVVRGADIDRDIDVRVDVFVVGRARAARSSPRSSPRAAFTVAILEGGRHTADDYTARGRGT